jgi:ribonuclease-3
VDERVHSYERLAFLGDSMLSLAVSQSLFPRFARYTAGRLTKLRAQAVSRRACVEVAYATGVPERLREVAPDAPEQQIEAAVGAESVLAEALEAGIGACLLHHGFQRTSETVAEAFKGQIDFAAENTFDFKSELQERLAQRGATVTYTVVREEGPPHEKVFETVAEVDGQRLGSGEGRSKKESEQEAAREALDRLGNEVYDREEDGREARDAAGMGGRPGE